MNLLRKVVLYVNCREGDLDIVVYIVNITIHSSYKYKHRITLKKNKFINLVIIKKIRSEGGSQLRSSLFWGVTERRLESSYRRFGTTYRSLLSISSSLRPGKAIFDCLTLEEGIDRFLRNVSNYKSTLCNTPVEQKFHLNSGGRLKSHEDLNCIQRHDHRNLKLL